MVKILAILSNIKGAIFLAFLGSFFLTQPAFTAAAVFRYVDKGMVSLNDPVSNWLEDEMVKEIANVDRSNIGHLLSHTSGIPDYYTTQFQLDWINKVNNDWTQEDMVRYAYGKKPTNGVGETYYYSNTNYVLLGIVLEKISGHSLEKIYQEEVFDVLGLTKEECKSKFGFSVYSKTSRIYC